MVFPVILNSKSNQQSLVFVKIKAEVQKRVCHDDNPCVEQNVKVQLLIFFLQYPRPLSLRYIIIAVR